jgi:hypothetical protein
MTAKHIQGENTLLQESVEALRRIGFLKDVQVVPPPQQGIGGKLRLKGAWGIATFQVEVQPKLLESALPALAQHRHSEPDRRLLVVTSYVPPGLAEQLQKRHIEFLDAAGNAYLDRPVYLFVSGRKPTHKPIRLNRALRPAGLRLLYVLLKNPAFLTKTQRELARAAGIALGSTPVVLQDLWQRGYLRRTGAGHPALANTRELLFRWEQGYGELLRPKLFAQTCRIAGSAATIDDLLPRLDRHPAVLLGGELAAAALTKHLRAETATLHITDDEKSVMSSLRLIPDPEGNITLLRTFGTQNASNQGAEELHLADPLLIHAELIQMGGDRIQEIGKILLDQHILPRLA